MCKVLGGKNRFYRYWLNILQFEILIEQFDVESNGHRQVGWSGNSQSHTCLGEQRGVGSNHWEVSGSQHVYYVSISKAELMVAVFYFYNLEKSWHKLQQFLFTLYMTWLHHMFLLYGR